MGLWEGFGAKWHCAENAQPRHGKVWTEVAKSWFSARPRGWRGLLCTGEILRRNIRPCFAHIHLQNESAWRLRWVSWHTFWGCLGCLVCNWWALTLRCPCKWIHACVLEGHGVTDTKQILKLREDSPQISAPCQLARNLLKTFSRNPPPLCSPGMNPSARLQQFLWTLVERFQVT